jgi:hypothetical protein
MYKPEGPSQNGAQWYIEVFNDDTNRALSEMLRGSGHFDVGVPCVGGEGHDICPVSYAIARYFKKSKTDKDWLDFVIWVKPKGAEKPKLWWNGRPPSDADRRRRLAPFMETGTGAAAKFPTRRRRSLKSPPDS